MYESILFFVLSHPLFSSHCVFFFGLFLLLCFCSSACLNLILTPPPAAQNANANADFANFDAFGSTPGSTGGFPSAPQASFHPSNTGRASSLHSTNDTHPNHSHIKTLAFIFMYTHVLTSVVLSVESLVLLPLVF